MTREEHDALLIRHGGHFKISEFEIQGPIDRMNTMHLIHQLEFRKWHGFSTLITSAWRKNDPRYHGLGLATDQILFHTWMETPLPAIHQFNLACLHGFRGVGVYLDWSFTDRSGNKQRTAGIHVDSGDRRNRPLRWFCREIEDEPYFYYMNPETGLFANKDLGEALTLHQAVEQYG
ncbi:MAG: hypothetical protein AAFW89_12945 [Bacteroidota bacterium]